MPSEEKGSWVKKTEPTHHCDFPDPGDYYDREFGDKSIWRCSCGVEYIYLESAGGLFRGDWDIYKDYLIEEQRKSKPAPVIVDTKATGTGRKKSWWVSG